ncbi:MAG: DUF2207 domain-containing protein [Gemmatimonadetes bacterium]|nr:DUF2207 domain-containing protein [Gemmatimonadota bacterium]
MIGLLIALGLGMAVPLHGQERSLAIERFDAAITVNRDGTIDVVETITARFAGSWNGLFRTIPVEYRTPQGFNWTIRLDFIDATDEQGRVLKTEAARERHYLKYKVWVPGALDATKTIVLRYRAKNGLRFFEDHDELYWNATGDEWDVPIQSASATVILPPDAAGIRATAFNGSYGATSRDASVITEGTTTRVTLPAPLAFREGLTIVVGWNKGLVSEPTTGDRALGFLAANWPLLIPIPVFFGMFALWRRRGRDPKRRPISVQYDPPPGMSPAEAGTLLDNSADMRDITGTLIDLAVRGYLKIEEKEEKSLFGLISTEEFVFHRQPVPAGSTDLKEHERAVLDGIFGGSGRSTIELSELENRFYKILPTIRNGIFAELVAKKYYRTRPDSVHGAAMFGAVALGAAIGIGGAILSPHVNLTPVPFIVAGALSAIIAGIFGYFMPARTEAGARALERVRGFEEFLERVEGDRLRDFVKTPELFERCLPFAMAFGVEKQWAKAFQGIYTTPPTWYAGGNYASFNAASFSHRLSTMSTRAESAMTSAPRSSSGSGFSGGSSGGGGGGGGGGGF